MRPLTSFNLLCCHYLFERHKVRFNVVAQIAPPSSLVAPFGSSSPLSPLRNFGIPPQIFLPFWILVRIFSPRPLLKNLGFPPPSISSSRFLRSSAKPCNISHQSTSAMALYARPDQVVIQLYAQLIQQPSDEQIPPLSPIVMDPLHHR